MTKMYRLEVYVMDLNSQFRDEKDLIDHMEYKTDFLDVDSVDCVDIGEWHDDHPLNKTDCSKAPYFPEYFGEVNEEDPWVKTELKRRKKIMMKAINDCSRLESENYKLKKEIKQLESFRDLLHQMKDVVKD